MTFTVVFPGQGAQSRGMGAALFDKYPRLIRDADDILGYSIRSLCLEDPDKRLEDTAYTQPALYVVNALSYLQKQELGLAPNYAAGHSLGEYNALFAAGVFDFHTGLRLVQKRGQLMGRARGGGMAAVIGLSAEAVQQVLAREGLSGVDIANFNAPTQLVISGLKEDVARAEAPLKEAGARHFVLLRVSAAFHSRYMVEAEKEFTSFLDAFRFASPRFPVFSNVHALPYEADRIHETLAAQISRPVRWAEIVRRLLSLDGAEFEEVGPGNVLAGLLRKIRAESEPLPWRPSSEPQPVAKPSPVATNPSARVEPPVVSLELSRPKPVPAGRPPRLTAESLGSADFLRDFGLRCACVSGAMYRGIASEALVIAMGRAGFMGIFGSAGLSPDRVDKAIQELQVALGTQVPFGMNLLHDINHPETEETMVDLFLKRGVRIVEASAFMQVTPALVRYRARGLRREPDGSISIHHRVVGKVSRPEVAQAFLSPAPERLLEQLVAAKKLTAEEARLARAVPMVDALTVEADSGGHTDQGVAFALLPAMMALRDRLADKHPGARRIHLGAAGGIGTPQAAAAAFMMGADYIVTGSINQCTVESGASAEVKALLQEAGVQDTTMAPSGDMFELGARVQVLRRGLFFPARANKLYELYRRYDALEQIDEKTRVQLETKYFKRSIAQVYEETKSYFRVRAPEEIEKAEANPKHKMALVFRWYFAYSTRLALAGDAEGRVDYQVHSGPAMGSFNAWVKGTELEPWQNRHVARVTSKLMSDTAMFLGERFTALGLYGPGTQQALAG
ncbi:ACP S-malonyltransferase [Myxococcus xanthus]|nr:ACP S-malonyltransferase [Myxococcus xanthus]QPM79758.1 ACP S-malonyltransferase [Myxococcus xanthus]QVV57710.1 MxnA [Vector pDPO-mxn116-Pvan-Tpase]